METTQTTNWIAIIPVIILVASTVGGATTAILGLWIDRKLTTHKQQILDHIDEKFALKELMDANMNTMRDGMKEIKDRMGKFEDRLNAVK